MNLEEIKKIAEKGKGGLKKTLTAAAIMAAVTSCGPTDKKAEATPPKEPKKEIVAKDTIKKVNDSTEKNTKEKGINSIEDLDDETLAMFDEWDAIHKEEQKKLEEQTSKQTPREKQGMSKKVYEAALSAIKRREETLQYFYDNQEVRESKKGLDAVNEAIENYHTTRELIKQPISPKAQKVIDLYNIKKKELNK